MFVLCKNGRATENASQLCRTSDQQLCVWNCELMAIRYAENHKYDNWLVRQATSEDFAIAGKMRANQRNKTRPCYRVMDEEKKSMATSRKVTSSGLLVEVFEDYEQRRFAISSKASTESEFLVEVAQALSGSPSSDWNTRLKEVLPLVVDMCCKYRGYKAESVHERRELIAGDLEAPRAV